MRVAWTPSLGERMLIRLGHWITLKTIGSVSDAVVYESVRTLGVAGWFRYMMTTAKVVGKLQREFGEAEAQFIISLSSLLIGCGYCTYGHALAGSLLWFRDKGAVHPLDPNAMSELIDLSDAEIIQRVEALLDDTQHETLRRLARRIYRLFLEQERDWNPQDELLEDCMWIWRWTTESTIVEGISIKPEDAQPLHPIAHDPTIRARYRAALVGRSTV
ncbi:MAG: hypothetical protein AAGF11_50270 [Myxococcota bacterium]